MKAASPPPIGDQELDDEDLPDLADTSGSEDEPVEIRRIQYSNSVLTAQVELCRRARRDEEQSVDQPVQKKSVLKLVLDKQKKTAAKEIDSAATESEESEDEEEIPS